MAPLERSDVSGCSLPRVEKEMRERLNDVQAIRLRAGSDFSKVAADDLDRVRDHNVSLQHLGDRRDELRERIGLPSHQLIADLQGSEMAA